jgi:hypothetical protein
MGSLRELCFGSLIPIAGHSHPASISFSLLANGKPQNGGVVSANGLRLQSRLKYCPLAQ